MSKSGEKNQPKGKEGLFNRGAKFYRTINVLSATAMIGAAVIFPEFAPVFVGLAAIDVAQASIVEYLRRRSKRKKETKLTAQPQPTPA